MKRLLLIAMILLTAGAAYSQDCENANISVGDKFTGKELVMTSPIGVRELTDANGDTVRIYARLAPDILNTRKIVLYIHAPELRCVEKDSKMYYVFEDGTRINTPNISGFNCKGMFSIVLSWQKGKKKDAFMNKRLTALRLVGGNVNADYDIPEDLGKRLLESIQCLNKMR